MARTGAVLARRTQAAAEAAAESTNVGARSKTLKRRAELLGVVYDCVSQHGIDGVSMRQIAEAAKISTGTINYHFGSKYNLIIAALEAAYDLPDDWEQYKGSPLGQLKRIAMGYVFRSANDRFWRFWINYLAHSTRDEVMRTHQNERYQRQARFWASLIRDGIAAGELRDDIDADAVAERLLLTAHGLIVVQLHSPTPEIREHVRDMLGNFFQEIMVPIQH